MKKILLKTISELKTNWIVNISFRFSVLLFVLSIGMILWRWGNLPSLVPLWYSKPWGQEQLAHPLFLFLLPLGNLFWYILDVGIVGWQGNQYRIFTQTLFLATFLSSFLTFITLAKILFLVT